MVKKWGHIPKIRVRPGQERFVFNFALLRTGLSVVGSNSLIVLGTWIKLILLSFLSLVGSIVRTFLGVV